MDHEIIEKMGKLQSLSDAIERAKATLAKEKSPSAALNLQRLQQDRDGLRATLPSLRVVS